MVIDNQIVVTNLILAGGRAERVDRRDKGLLPLTGQPLIAHSLCRLRSQIAELLINANRYLDTHPVVLNHIEAFGIGLAPIPCLNHNEWIIVKLQIGNCR